MARTLGRTAPASDVVLIPGVTGRRAELREGLGHNRERPDQQRAPGMSSMRVYFYISSFAQAYNVEVSSVGRVSYSTCDLLSSWPMSCTVVLVGVQCIFAKILLWLPGVLLME